MYPIRKGMPFYGSLLILGLWRYYPSNNQNKKQFYIIFFIWILLWPITFTTSNITQCVLSLNKHDYFLATTAFPVTVGVSLLSTTNILFAIYHNLWSNIMKDVADCSKFGTSPNFDSITQRGHKTGIRYMFLLGFIIIISSIYEIIQEKSCLARYGRKEMCGLLSAGWFPPYFENSVIYKRLTLLYQILAVIGISTFTIVITLQYQICQFIEDKSEHLSVLFNELHNDENTSVQKRKFEVCVEYHQHMIHLCKKLNYVCRRNFGHITLFTSIVLSFLFYHGMNGNYKFVVYTPVYILNLWFMCHTGQKLEDAMSNVGDFLYLSHWDECCVDVKNMIPLVIQRSQRSIGLEAIPIGRLNYVLFMMPFFNPQTSTDLKLMYPIRKDMPFYGSLLILGLWRYYPLNNQNKKQFYIILFFWLLLWFVPFTTSNITECILSLNRHDYFSATTAFPIALGATILSTTNILFAIYHNLWSNILKDVADCSKFGTSPNFDSIKQRGDKTGIRYMMYIAFILIISTSYEIIQEKSCIARYGRKELCGLVTAGWFPPHFNNSVIYRRLLLLYQLLSVVVMSTFAIVVTLQYQICQLIEDKSEHLSVLFNEIHNDECTSIQKRKFEVCVEYHQHMIYLCEELDHLCRRTLGHITLSTSIVLSFLLYHGMSGNYKFFIYAPAYVLNLWFMCHTGQKLEDAMSKVGDFLYLSHWYECCIDVKNMIPLVIQRSQRSIGLQAIPIGRLNYVLFTMVVKTTYTYLNVLNHNSLT